MFEQHFQLYRQMLCKFQMVIHLHAYYLHHTAKINQNLAVGQCSPAVITGICCKTKPVLGSGTDFSSSYYRNPPWKCRHTWLSLNHISGICPVTPTVDVECQPFFLRKHLDLYLQRLAPTFQWIVSTLHETQSRSIKFCLLILNNYHTMHLKVNRK